MKLNRKYSLKSIQTTLFPRSTMKHLSPAPTGDHRTWSRSHKTSYQSTTRSPSASYPAWPLVSYFTPAPTTSSRSAWCRKPPPSASSSEWLILPLPSPCLFITLEKHNNIKDFISNEHTSLKKINQRFVEAEQRERREHQRFSRRGQPPPVDCLHRGAGGHCMGWRIVRTQARIYPRLPDQTTTDQVYHQDVPPQHLQRRTHLPR